MRINNQYEIFKSQQISKNQLENSISAILNFMRGVNKLSHWK
ncbi:hypothetical protein COO91_01438 [Nostoc flagelliforme CCNUN1]|uniref:Uncharacterized protein n=1 Tax=Nostoc flagelliforme CCNUN1 TaxID=2038116 RepID=A0A2K8SJM4_9NOSO|nr:hypothetical protein COO91_01438 [Nostoc flagelliforme CCNUN1]